MSRRLRGSPVGPARQMRWGRLRFCFEQECAHGSRAFSSEVDTGSRQENATKLRFIEFSSEVDTGPSRKCDKIKIKNGFPVSRNLKAVLGATVLQNRPRLIKSRGR